MFLVSSCSCLCPIRWSQVLSREWGGADNLIYILRYIWNSRAHCTDANLRIDINAMMTTELSQRHIASIFHGLEFVYLPRFLPVPQLPRNPSRQKGPGHLVLRADQWGQGLRLLCVWYEYKIICDGFYCLIVLKLDRRLGSSATETPV